jgi:hypothetical protein
MFVLWLLLETKIFLFALRLWKMMDSTSALISCACRDQDDRMSL